MRWISLRMATALGWRIEGALPDVPKMVVVAYPHTSNWDFALFLAAIAHQGVRVRFLAAEGLFVGPFGWFLRRSGGIPVDQDGSRDSVRDVVEAFTSSDRLILVIAPEGTRRRTGAWRSGFWRIADAADVPVVMVKVDADRKRVVFGPAAPIDGDPHRWMGLARSFYGDAEGLRPSEAGAVRLRGEILGETDEPG